MTTDQDSTTSSSGYDSIYNVKYLFEERQVLLHDEVNDLYNVVEPHQLNALVNAYFLDAALANKIIVTIYSGKEVKISFKTQQAAIAPALKYDFSNMTLGMMYETSRVPFKDKEEMMDYFLSRYGAVMKV